MYTTGCGNSASKAAKLSNTALSVPAAPTAITITPLITNVCNNRVYRYSAPSLPVASTTAGEATGWLWELTGSLSEFATIDSGDEGSQKIVVSFTSNAAAATGDSIKLTYLSLCGNSKAKASKLTNAKLSAPAAPASVTIQTVSDVCGARVYRYIAPSPLPAATTTTGVATGYLWTSPTGTVGGTFTLDSGLTSGRIIRYRYSSNAAAGIGDSIRVRYTSGCGNGAVKAQKLSNLAKVCLTSGTPITSRVASTSVETATLNVYPNPNNGTFMVSAKTSTTAKSTATIQIIDMLGKVVAQVNAQNNNGTINTNINNSNLKNGVYTVRIMVGNDIKTVKMVVKK